MQIVIAGSRNFKDHYKVENYVCNLKELQLNTLNDIVIISGGAFGVDSLAASKATQLDLKTKIFYPEWDKYGKKAGPMRNEQMVQASDKVVVFWDGISRGSKSTIDFALKYKKDLEVIFEDKNNVS